ncbi:MAG: metallophosphoesterase family protein [Verrucomicrobiae bacterium]|nr:metallophosphoesterase family protein [Verrucomicrobiae bacterium]
MSETLRHHEFSRTRQGGVVSDLHLFSRRSDGDSLFGEFEIDAANHGIDALVLNGDTFDFRWSCLPSESHTIAAAMEWLDALLERRPHWTVHFLLGNHDCLDAFRPELQALAARQARFHWHEHRLRLGDRLFLHGDCANYRMSEQSLGRFREKWRNDRPRGSSAARLYSAADGLGFSHLVHGLWFPQSLTISRIAHHLDQVDPGWEARASHCYFGHTHRPFHHRQRGGVRFSNTGSAIRGMGFRPLFFEWREPDSDPSPGFVPT